MHERLNCWYKTPWTSSVVIPVFLSQWVSDHKGNKTWRTGLDQFYGRTRRTKSIHPTHVKYHISVNTTHRKITRSFKGQSQSLQGWAKREKMLQNFLFLPYPTNAMHLHQSEEISFLICHALHFSFLPLNKHIHSIIKLRSWHEYVMLKSNCLCSVFQSSHMTRQLAMQHQVRINSDPKPACDIW